jgi:uncharacterized protein YkwD
MPWAWPADYACVRVHPNLLTLLAIAAALLLALPFANADARGTTRSIAVHHRPAGHKAHKQGKHRRRHKPRDHKRSHHKPRHHKRSHHKRKAHAHRTHAKPTSAVTSDSCPGASVAPNRENLEAVRAATLCLINLERARYGEPALVNNVHLSEAATAHSYDMVARDYFEHVSPDGQTLLTRVWAAKFIPNSHVGYALGENIAWGTLWLATPHSIVKAWMADPGHRANILKRSFRFSGIGIDPAAPASKSRGQAGAMYTQDFGTIIAA